MVTPDGRRRRERVVDAPSDSRQARETLSAFVDQAGEVAAVGHRVVHGGEQITGATMATTHRRRIGTGPAIVKVPGPPESAAGRSAAQCRRTRLPAQRRPARR